MKNEIILIQHTDSTTPGLVLPWLKARQGSYRHIFLNKGDALPTPHQGQSIILCGGAPHVDQEEEFPWLKPEKKFLEESIKLGNKVVGLCLGGQLCAQVLGARVYPHQNGWEIGWWDVNLHQTPGLVGFESAQSIRFSQHHRYIFEAPKSSLVVASNDWWETQAFLWNHQVLGIQFHPERDLPGNKISSVEENPRVDGVTQTPAEIIELGCLHQPTAASWFRNVLNGFL